VTSPPLWGGREGLYLSKKMQLPENINIEFPERYILTIRITPIKLAFGLYEPDKEEIIYYNEITFSIDDSVNSIHQAIYDSDFLTLPYQKTNVIYVSDDYELAPQYLIQKDKKEILYNFTHQSPAKQILYCEEIIQEIVTVFNVEEEFYKFLSRNLFNVEFMHHTNIMMQYIEKCNKNRNSYSKMYLHFHEKFVDIFCYNSTSQLQHAITIRDENKHNTAYHILNIWDKCGFDQINDYLYILGSQSDINLFIGSVIKDYIKNMDTITVNNTKRILSDTPLPLDLLILLNK